MSSNLSRRRFLQVSGLTAGTAAAGLTVLGNSAHAAPLVSPRLQARGLAAVDAGIPLFPSNEGEPNADFVTHCQEVIDRKTAAGEFASLDTAVARLCSDEPVRLHNLGEAEAWLQRKGYLASLEHFTRLGGRNVIIFPELNIVGDPHFSTAPRTMAYLSVALRRAFWNGGHRGLYTFFPGPARAEKVSTGTWHSGIAEYFTKYDLLGRDRKVRTFGATHPQRVDPAISDLTQLSHSGMGAFDGLALAAEGAALDRQIEWVQGNLGDVGILLATRPSRDVRTERVADSSMVVSVARGSIRTGVQAVGPAAA